MSSQHLCRRTLSSLALLLLSTILVLGQSVTEYKGANLALTISGTSTLHDWHMTTSSAEGSIAISLNGDAVSINKAEVEFQAETLKSGKKGMDKNAYKALDIDEHPGISFRLNPIEVQNGYEGEVVGDLSVSGVSRKVTLIVTIKVSQDEVIVSGKTDFKLTDFQVEPPKALMGTIKTGNEVSIEFNTTFKSSKL